jgi:hypothetical protein
VSGLQSVENRRDKIKSAVPDIRPQSGVVVHSFSLCHVPDPAVLPNLRRAVSHGCKNTAIVLAYISEADERRLYAPAGYDSIHPYLVDELNFSEDAAGKRIHAARTCRRFPALFEAVCAGRSAPERRVHAGVASR